MTGALADIFDATCARLARAAADPRSPWRLPVLATARTDASPGARIVVLRSCLRDPLRLDVFTDERSPKAGEISAEPRVALVFWDKGASLQLRLEGTAELLTGGPDHGAARQRLSGYEGADYARRAIPGAPLGAPDAGEDRLADALAHFALVRIEAERLDWLDLGRAGHRRAEFTRATGTGAWTASWLVP